MSQITTSVTRRPGFFDFPREIRDIIYEAVLQPDLESSQVPGGNSCICSNEAMKTHIQDSIKIRKSPFDIPAGQKPLHINNHRTCSPQQASIAILLLNKQAYHEALPFIYSAPISLDLVWASTRGTLIAFQGRSGAYHALPRVALNRFSKITVRTAARDTVGMEQLKGRFYGGDGYQTLQNGKAVKRFFNKLKDDSCLETLKIEYWFQTIVGPGRRYSSVLRSSNVDSPYKEACRFVVALNDKIVLSSSIHICVPDGPEVMTFVKAELRNIEKQYNRDEGCFVVRHETDQEYRLHMQRKAQRKEEDKQLIGKHKCAACGLITWTEADQKKFCSHDTYAKGLMEFRENLGHNLTGFEKSKASLEGRKGVTIQLRGEQQWIDWQTFERTPSSQLGSVWVT